MAHSVAKLSMMSFLLICLALSTSPTLAEASTAELVARMPAQNAEDAAAINAEFVALGPNAVKELCAMIAPFGAGDDAKAEFALSGLVKHVSRSGADPERAMVEKALIESLSAAKDDEAKAFLIRQIQVIGKAQSVRPLSGFLASDRLCEPATQALLAIRGKAVCEALEKALPKAVDARRVTVIRALGELRCDSAAKAIAKDAGSGDRVLRETALFALANMAHPKSDAVLAKAIESAATPSERAVAVVDYALYAQRLAENGKPKDSEAIYRALAKNKSASAQCAALSGIVALNGASALSDLLAAMDSDDAEVRGAALLLAPAIPGEDATKQWAAKMVQAQPGVRADMLCMLGRRGDKAALAPVLDAMKDQDKSVRIAAANAAINLGGSEALPALLDRAKTASEADEIKNVKEDLLRVPGNEWPAAVVGALPACPPPMRKALLEVLSARRATAQREPVFAQTKDADESVRVAAISALGNLADPSDLPRLIDLASTVASDGEASAAQKVVVSTAKQIAEPEQRADAILAALSGASAAKKARLYPTLAGVGGKRALEAVAGDSKAKDAVARDAAVRALADWPDSSALPALLGVVKTSKDETHRVLALRGYTRIVGAAEASSGEKLARCQDAMKIVRRAEDKKLLLASVADVRTVDALKYVATFLDDKTLQADAAQAAVRIACPKDDKDKGLATPETAAILKKAAGFLSDEEARKKAEAFVATIPAP